jgi:hypothetical protein
MVSSLDFFNSFFFWILFKDNADERLRSVFNVGFLIALLTGIISISFFTSGIL